MRRDRAHLVVPLTLAVLSGDCSPPAECDGGICLDLAGAERARVGFGADTAELTDVDGDGHLDFVAAGHEYGTLTVVWGGVDMLEGTATTWSVAPAVRGLAVGDFDGDGRFDLATAVPDGDAIAVLHGSGGRDFLPATLHPVGVHPRDLIAVELDGDGTSELVVAHDDGAIHVLRQLVAGAELSVGSEPHDLAAGDLDGDGDLDLVLALPEQGALQVLLGDGDGGLTLGARLSPGTAPTTVVAADFDDDGVLDLAATDALEDVAHILFGDGAGNVRDISTWVTAPEPRALVVASRGPGLPVLIVMSAETGLIQQIDPLTGTTLSGSLRERRASVVASGDVTGDSVDELLYVDDFYGRIGLFAPGLGLLIEPAGRAAAAGSVFPVALDDDRDGLVINLSPQPPGEVSATTLAIAIASGPDQLSAPFASGLDAPLQGALAADLNGDGRRELVVWNPTTIAVHERVSDGTLAPPITARPGTSGEILASDVDGDGRSELVLVAPPKRLRALNPFAEEAALVDVQLDEMPQTMAARDADGDGVLDLVLRNAARVQVYPGLHIADPPQLFTLEHLIGVQALEILDLERDGRPDAFVCHVSGLARYPDRFGPAPGEIELLDDAYCQMLAATDLDGDDADELLAVSFDTAGGLAVTPWRLSAGQIERLGTYSIGALELPRLARLHGSEPFDLLVPRPDGHAGIFQMSLGTAFQATTLHSLGAALGLTLGDFDGDGALDLLGLGEAIGLARGDGQGFGPIRRVALERVDPNVRRISGAAVGNFDDDGADEVAVSLHLGGRDGYEVATLDPAEMSITRLAGPTSGSPKIITADIDGDGLRDLLTLTGATETPFGAPTVLDVAFYRGRTGGMFDPPATSRLDGVGSPDALRTADLDGDGRLDLLTPVGGLGVHRGRGNGQFDPIARWSPVKANQFAVGDLDRDGHLDVAATTTGYSIRRDDLIVLEGSGASRLGSPQVVLSDASALAIADLDMDGNLELLAAGSGALYIGRGGNGNELRFAHYSLPIPAPGFVRVLDIDGDAALDLALLDGSGVTLVRQLP